MNKFSDYEKQLSEEFLAAWCSSPLYTDIFFEYPKGFWRDDFFMYCMGYEL